MTRQTLEDSIVTVLDGKLSQTDEGYTAICARSTASLGLHVCKTRSATDDDDGFAAAESHVRELSPLHHLQKFTKVTWHITEECRVPGF